MRCKICTHESSEYGHGNILGKYKVCYYRCLNCGLIQTEEPYWLDEAYSDAITRSDIGLASRSVISAQITETIIQLFFSEDQAFLDYGGGYGLMVRLMRDAGFDYYREDKYCENLFAQGFDTIDRESATFELLTAFEVFEHLVDPVEELAKMLKHSQTILFSTMLLPEPVPMPGEWWYYGLEHGQHVALYTRQALTILGRQFGLRYYSDNRSFHLLTDRRLSEKRFRVAVRAYKLLTPMMALVKRRKSLIQQDFFALTGQLLP